MPYIFQIRVAEEDTDGLGHANNLSYIRWLLEAALQHWVAAGLDRTAYRMTGQAFVVRRHEIDYLRPAFLGDGLAVETRVISMRGVSSERQTLIRRQEDGQVLLRGLTSWAYIDLKSGRPVRIPPDIKDRFPVEARDDRPGTGR